MRWGGDFGVIGICFLGPRGTQLKAKTTRSQPPRGLGRRQCNKTKALKDVSVPSVLIEPLVCGSYEVEGRFWGRSVYVPWGQGGHLKAKTPQSQPPRGLGRRQCNHKTPYWVLQVPNLLIYPLVSGSNEVGGRFRGQSVLVPCGALKSQNASFSTTKRTKQAPMQ